MFCTPNAGVPLLGCCGVVSPPGVSVVTARIVTAQVIMDPLSADPAHQTLLMSAARQKVIDEPYPADEPDINQAVRADWTATVDPNNPVFQWTLSFSGAACGDGSLDLFRPSAGWSLHGSGFEMVARKSRVLSPAGRTFRITTYDGGGLTPAWQCNQFLFGNIALGTFTDLSSTDFELLPEAPPVFAVYTAGDGRGAVADLI